MDSFEYNKIIGALLGTIFVVFSIALLSDAIFSSPKPEKPGFTIKAEETVAAGAAKPAAPVQIAPLLAKADPKKGEQIFHRCEACHDGTKGGPNKVGPNLWGVVGRPIASHPGYSYSAGMKKFSDDSKKHWTYQLISEFITSPRKEVPGTAMGFAGLDDPQDRANVISYLRTLSDNPEPLPSPEAEKASAPADGKAPAAASDQGKAPAAKAPASGDNKGQAPAQGAAPKTGDQTK
ncbi:MAG TPA: cytochrome c family protein [Rhizobiaceae bacterium]|jgi:cytochrome c|nr:cytochrome c family protein [Rhizobiaceae bacterium]